MVTRKGVNSRKEHKHTKHNHSHHKNDVIAVEEESMTPQDKEIIEKSFETIKELNNQVKHVENSKKVLEKEVEKLSKKVDSQTNAPLKHNKILLSIKEEIIKEFTPLLSKLNIKDMKFDVVKEVESLIDIELEKIRSEFEGNEKKLKRTFTQTLSDLEVRLVESLKEQEVLKKELRNIESTHAPDILEDLEKKIEATISKTKKTLAQDHIKAKKNLELIEQSVSNYELEVKKSLKEFKRSKTLFEKSLQETQKDSSLLESKVVSLEKELKGIHSLVERYENDLYSREQQEELDIEKKVSSKLQETQKLLNNFSKVKDAHEAFLTKKLNSIIDNVDSFEKRLLSLEKKDMDSIKEYAKEQTQKIVTKQNKEFDKFLKSSAKEFTKEKNLFEKKLLGLEKEFETFKSQSSGLLKEYLANLDNEISALREFAKNEEGLRDAFSQDQQKKFEEHTSNTNTTLEAMSSELKAFEDFMKKKSSELDSRQENFFKEVKVQVENYKTDIDQKTSKTLEDSLVKTKEQTSEEILKIKNELTRASTDMKEASRDLKEDLEKKFYSLKLRYDETLDTHLNQIEKEFSERETSFVRKISELAEEKNQLFKDIESFKTEIAALTKEFSTQIEGEMSSLKKEHVDFENHKDEFVSKLDNLTHMRRVQLHEDYDSYKREFSELISTHKKDLVDKEDSFKTLFNEKISSLWDFMNSKLESIDKKFVDKNVVEIKKFFDKEKKELQAFEQTIFDKSKELDRKFENAEQKELEFFESLHQEQEGLQEKVEERLMQLEQQLNKRFLDLDEDFAHVKGVVLDEVEGLMRDVTTSFDEKIHTLEGYEKKFVGSMKHAYEEKIASISTYETKLKFALSEAMKKLQELSNINEFVEDQIKDVRDDVNDLRVKVDVLDPHSSAGSIHSFVATMADYENHLLGLVSSLRAKGVSDEHILDLLETKGHPRVYSSMLMKSKKNHM